MYRFGMIARVTLCSALLLAACASQPPAAPDPYAKVNTVGKDRGVWMQLLEDHASIRRTVVHTQEGDLGEVVATTESDDPAVIARIQDHAKAMYERMQAGAMVRGWDPVFVELFENHGKVRLEVTLIERGVRIRESSTDPVTVALMRSHATGVNDFVREGMEANDRETAKVSVGVLPPSEIAIGGVPQRFLLVQPDAVQTAGPACCSLPSQSAAELTDQVLDQARAALIAAAKNGQAVAVQGGKGDCTGPAWAAYRVLDCGVPLNQAVTEARALQMTDPAIEAAVRTYITQHQK